MPKCPPMSPLVQRLPSAGWGVEPTYERSATMNDQKSGRRSRSVSARSKGRRGNNEGGIYQRESEGLWCASVSVESGKRKVLYGKTREDVASKLITALNDVKNGLTLPSYRMTLGAFLEQWLADVVWQRNRPSAAQRPVHPRNPPSSSESSPPLGASRQERSHPR